MELTEQIIKLADGNFGAVNIMLYLPKEGLNQLETLGIRGTAIYVLYSDICDGDSEKTLALINATRNGELDSTILIDACSRQDYSGKEIIEREYWSKK